MVKREDFHLMQWSMGIPLCEDVWLGMQLRNIAIVDLGVLRDIELQAMQSYFADDRVDGNILMLLSATSQMWVFSLYEFMRTWRSKAKHILKTAAEYQTVAPRKKKKFLRQILDNAEGKHKFVRIAPNFYHEQLSKIDDPAFVASVQKYFDDTAGLFSEVSFLRVALAKHEVEGKPGFAAEALHPIRDEAIRSRPVRSLAACGKLQAASGPCMMRGPGCPSGESGPSGGAGINALMSWCPKARDPFAAHVATDHSFGQARLKRLVDDAAAPARACRRFAGETETPHGRIRR